MRGGKREGAGRKSIGVSRRAALTLSEELWSEVDALVEDQYGSLSAFIRECVEEKLSQKTKKEVSPVMQKLIDNWNQFGIEKLSIGKCDGCGNVDFHFRLSPRFGQDNEWLRLCSDCLKNFDRSRSN